MLDRIDYASVLSSNSNAIEDGLKVHGPYTEGFYEQEMEALKNSLKA